MRTIQMTLDDELVESVDKLVKELNTSRSAFTRDALRVLHRPPRRETPAGVLFPSGK
jgi:metal-responsive CopG/Arc/MetJ family transcriptional regulator